MKLSPHSLVLVPVCLLLSLAGSAPAQGLSPSHKPLDDRPLDRASAEQQLKARLGHTEEMNHFNKLLENLLKDFKLENLTDEERKRLLDLAEKQQKEGKLDLNDPQVAKVLEKMPGLKKADLTPEEKQKLIELTAKQQEGKPLDFKDPKVAHIVEKLNGLKPGDLSQDDLEALKKIGQQQKHGQPLNLDDPQISKVVKKLLEGNKKDLGLDDKQFQDLWNKFGSQPTPPPIGSGRFPPYTGQTDPSNPPHSGAVPPNELPRPGSGPMPVPNQGLHSADNRASWLGRQLSNVADKLDLSPEVKNDLAKWAQDSAKNGDPGKSSVLSNLSDYFPAGKINDAGSFFGKMKLPSMPSVSPVSPQAPNAPTGGAGLTVGGADGLLNVVIVFVIVVIAGIVTWKLMSLKQGQAEKADDRWQLGAWPVHPSAVRTRADLVKAFEYLAVLLLGPKARTRHHLELAEELGRESKSADSRRSESARTLAYLYEIARYTPEEETLPPNELATAQHELSFLAGAASA